MIHEHLDKITLSHGHCEWWNPSKLVNVVEVETGELAVLTLAVLQVYACGILSLAPAQILISSMETLELTSWTYTRISNRIPWRFGITLKFISQFGIVYINILCWLLLIGQLLIDDFCMYIYNIDVDCRCAAGGCPSGAMVWLVWTLGGTEHQTGSQGRIKAWRKVTPLPWCHKHSKMRSKDYKRFNFESVSTSNSWRRVNATLRWHQISLWFGSENLTKNISLKTVCLLIKSQNLDLFPLVRTVFLIVGFYCFEVSTAGTAASVVFETTFLPVCGPKR